MSDTKALEAQIKKLEERILQIEQKLSNSVPSAEEAHMNDLYLMARALVIKHNKASAIFLQMKLLIDYQRASQLLTRLQANGVITAGNGMEPRKIIGQKQAD